jgi:hypothetical protein
LTSAAELADGDAIGKAFRDERDRVGLAKALTTEAGRAWLKPSEERKDRELSGISPEYAVVNRWPIDMVVPDTAADAIARAAVHADAGFGQSFLELACAAKFARPVFGPGAAMLKAAGCPDALSLATAEWSLALTHAGTVVRRTERKPRGQKNEVDVLVAARGRAHADLLLSRLCFPAIAAAAWCTPVELTELWYFVTDALGVRRARLDELTLAAVAWVHRAFTQSPADMRGFDTPLTAGVDVVVQ